MKLYYKPGACSLASHIALTEIGADFSIEKVDTKEKRTASGADFLKISPNGYVPALELDSGDILLEGPAILQHLADAYPDAGLAPKPGTVERARVNQYLNFVGSELHKAFSPLFVSPSPEGAVRDAAVAAIAKRLDYLEAALEDGREYLTGDNFTVADAYLFVVAGWTKFVGVDLSNWPKLTAFVARVAARTATQKALVAEGLLAKAA